LLGSADSPVAPIGGVKQLPDKVSPRRFVKLQASPADFESQAAIACGGGRWRLRSPGICLPSEASGGGGVLGVWAIEIPVASINTSGAAKENLRTGFSVSGEFGPL
jgi:hypothetical protein